MNATEKNLLYRTLKDVRRTSKNGKIHTACKAFSEAYSFFCCDQNVELDEYLEQAHPWLAIRYAFDWSKDIRNGESYWKNINHQWEEVLIKNKMANSGVLKCLTVDELKAQSRDFFKDAQNIGTSQHEAIDLFLLYAEERDERERKKKEAEEAEAQRKREEHLANQKKHEEALAQKNNNTTKVSVPTWTSSVIDTNVNVDTDDDDDDDYVILNAVYSQKSRIAKGEMKIENTGNNSRITMSSDDSSVIIASGYKYVCIKKDGTLLFNDDANRGAKLCQYNSIIKIHSKILVEYLSKQFDMKDGRWKLKISDATVLDNGIAYKILSATKA